jgi:predicted RNase H-like nuclease
MTETPPAKQGIRAVLGIDAAWTMTQPSGVASVVESLKGWRLAGVAPSYGQFLGLVDPTQQTGLRPAGSQADSAKLIACASDLCGAPIGLVAIDMPLARTPIHGRRASDRAVSTAYGARQCGTHSPSALRPGTVGVILRDALAGLGYPLQTTSLASRGVIEVYPHPALVELAGAAKRLPYKVSRIRQYWPNAKPAERRQRLLHEWEGIVDLLECRINGVRAALPLPLATAATFELKAFEDTLDAIVCAWVAVCTMEGRAKPYGDDDSAIWIPIPP